MPLQALAAGDAALLTTFHEYLANNTLSLCSADAQDASQQQLAFGEFWQGPFVASAFPQIATGAGIDLLNAWCGAGPAALRSLLPALLAALAAPAESFPASKNSQG